MNRTSVVEGNRFTNGATTDDTKQLNYTLKMSNFNWLFLLLFKLKRFTPKKLYKIHNWVVASKGIILALKFVVGSLIRVNLSWCHFKTASSYEKLSNRRIKEFK